MRRQSRDVLLARLEPLLNSNLSDKQVARMAYTSPTTVARHRRTRGITLDSVVGKDGKEYPTGSTENRLGHSAAKHLAQALEAIRSAGAEEIRERVEPLLLEINAEMAAEAE